MFLTSIGFTSYAQQALTMDQMVERSMANSHKLTASQEQIHYSQLMEKTAGFVPDPFLVLESPTGDRFALGVQQSFQFPTVYAKQKQLARQQTTLAIKDKTLTEQELKKQFKLAYLEWQYSTAQRSQIEFQDSLLNTIAQSADRQYQAGQIDFVEKTYAAMKYVEVHSLLLGVQVESRSDLYRIQQYTGIQDSLYPAELKKTSSDFLLTTEAVDQDALMNAPIMAYHLQNEIIGEKGIQLEKNRMFPNITIGYLNQADQETPFAQRLNFGLSVPLWFWQYSTTINAAKARWNVAKQFTAAGEQALTQEWITAKSDAMKYQAAMAYYETQNLVQVEELTIAAQRMFAAGEYDYIKYLTTVSDAFHVSLKYTELIKKYNEAIISLQYLIGQ